MWRQTICLYLAAVNGKSKGLLGIVGVTITLRSNTGVIDMILDRNSFGIWSFLAKRVFRAAFRRPNLSLDEYFGQNFAERNVGIYIHIPFCTGRCSFCPYVRYMFERGLVRKYVKALKLEIEFYGKMLRNAELRVVDIHAGGGTPSLLDAKDFYEIIEALNENFEVSGQARFGIEVNPEDFTAEKASEFADSGIDEVSIGVQSFFTHNLKLLGRRHSVEDSLEAIENARNAGFKLINIDMMYMLPGQTLKEWVSDIKIAAEQEVDEITIYPTLVTSYVPAYKMLKGEKIKEQPSKRTFKEMLYAAYEILKMEGYNPIEIYGFSRSNEKYATVNLEMEGPLLGFGAGAMGFTGHYEYQNTCSVREYVRSIYKKRHPIAGIRKVDKKEQAIRWATCELFICRNLNLNKFKERFGEKFDKVISQTSFGKALKFLKLLGIIKSDGNTIELTEKGLFAANQLCWAFVLNVPCRITEEFLKTPWPIEVNIP